MGHDTWTDRDFADPQPLDHDETIRRELAPGEKVVWIGRPRVVRSFLLAVPIALFGLFFGCFSLLWIGGTWLTDVKFLTPFGLPFVLVGLAMILSPAWVAWRASRTRYAITDRRVILCEAQFLGGIETRSYTADALTNIVRTQRGDGSGDLIFEEFRTRNHEGHLRTTRRGFQAIEDVRGVENLLRSTLLADRVQP